MTYLRRTVSVVAGVLLFGFALAGARAAPLCRASFERSFALASRKAFEEFSSGFPHLSDPVLRAPFGADAAHFHIFTNRSQRPAASRLLLVLPGSGFHPAYMLQNLDRSVPDNTEVAVFEYPYLSPDFDAEGPFMDSEQIATALVSGLRSYRQQHGYDTVGIYASSMGGALAAKMLQQGTRVDFLVLDGVQESRPLPLVCSSEGWLRDVLPPLLSELSQVTLITNRDDRKERTRVLRKLGNSATFTVLELAARHPWEHDADVELRVPFLKAVFERSL
jgi:pimeloyl-ACP methyl ester carboxylesterase